MSGLFGMLGSAARALDAQRFGLDVTGQNIANVNSPGYTRRVPLLSEGTPLDRFEAGGGVEVDGVRALRNRFVEQRLWRELPAEQREGAIAESLNLVEVSLGQAGQSLDDRLSQLFDSFARLADAPTSATARQEVVLQGRALASAFNQTAEGFEHAQREADTRIRATIDDINALAERIASLNASLGGITRASGQALHLRDEVRAAVADLAKIVDIDAVERSDGSFDISVGNGRALVVGEHHWGLAAVSQPVTGLADIVASDGTVITGEIEGGSIAGFLHVRDTLLPGYRTSLDELAYSVAQEVNALHTAGFDRNGNAGQPFFEPLATSADAAETIAINPALLASGGETLVVASSDAAAVGDNAIARALASLRDEPVMAGGTATLADAWSRLVYRVGRDTQAARDEQSSRSELVRQVEALHESVSGVSLDEEAANLLRFQRAYEANARYFRVIDDTLSTLLQLAGV